MKRSNSTPNINLIARSAASKSSREPKPLKLLTGPGGGPPSRPSCFTPKVLLPASSSNLDSPNNGSSSASTNQYCCSPIGEKTLSRLLKEDSSNLKSCLEHDYANERFFRSASFVSNCWKDFHIDIESSEIVERKRAKSVCEPVHCIVASGANNLFNPLPSSSSCSPSPSRSGDKQCYSPSMRKVVHNAYRLSPSPSPSPTRRHSSFLRSLSPIAVRSVTVTKRKLDDDDADSDCSNNGGLAIKRRNLSTATVNPVVHNSYSNSNFRLSNFSPTCQSGLFPLSTSANCSPQSSTLLLNNSANSNTIPATDDVNFITNSDQASSSLDSFNME